MTDSSLDIHSRDGRSNVQRPSRRSAYFPRRYLTDFFDFLTDNKSFQVLTYADLPWGGDIDYANDYPNEWRNWKAQLASGKRDPNKFYLVLQYDVDSKPESTMALLEEPSHQSIPANIMIFNRRVDRRRLKESREVELTEYGIDFGLLRRLESKRFVVGYHCNAYERAGFDVSRALDIFDEDVRTLSRNFQIRFFSAHGGVPDAEGHNNRHLPFHPDWVSTLKWVHNGHAVRFDGHYSDGGHNSPQSVPSRRDLRSFISKMRPGGRYGILLHPQYYGLEPRASPRFSGTPWYDDMMRADRESDGRSLWDDVKPEGRRPSYGSELLVRLKRWFRPHK